MGDSRLPIFSHSGAQVHEVLFAPKKHINETEATIAAEAELFSLLQSISEGSSHQRVNMNTLPFIFKGELELLFNPTGHHLSLPDLKAGIRRMGNHYLSRDDAVQKRANAFIRVQMAATEMILYGKCKSLDMETVERDQKLVYESSTPNRSVFSSGYSTPSSTSTPLTPVSSSKQQTRLFRSESLHEDDLKENPVRMCEFDDLTVEMMHLFLNDYFKGGNSIVPSKYSREEMASIEELWQYFCHEERWDVPISRHDLTRGFTAWAENFIASDETCQILANYYCEKKVRIACQRLLSATSGPEPLNREPFAVGSSVTYTDGVGMRHAAHVIRPLSVDGSLYDIELEGKPGIKMSVNSKTLVLKMAQSTDLSDCSRMESDVRVAEPNKLGSFKIEGVGNTASVRTSRNNYTSPRVTASLLPPSVADEKSNDLSGRVLNLKSNGAYPSRSRSSSVEDKSSSKGTQESKYSTNDMENPDPMTRGSNIDSHSSSSKKNQFVGESVSSKSLQRDDKSEQSKRDGDAEGGAGDDSLPPSRGSNPNSGGNGDKGGGSSEGDAGGNVHDDSVPITEEEQRVLVELMQHGGVDSCFYMRPESIPDPRRSDSFDLWLNVNNKRQYFYFRQVDYGIRFGDFLSPPFLETSVSEEVLPYRCSQESNRCFFLHLGVAIGLHPFALQTVFRMAAADILSRPEEINAIFFGECLKAEPEDCYSQPGILNRDGVFVDATSLLPIWPKEMDEFRVLVCKLNEYGSLEHYTLFEPKDGPRDAHGQWAGKDVIMTNQFGHFCVLKPRDESDKNPITLLLATAHSAAAQHGTTEPLVYHVEYPESRYSVAKVAASILAECNESEKTNISNLYPNGFSNAPEHIDPPTLSSKGKAGNPGETSEGDDTEVWVDVNSDAEVLAASFEAASLDSAVAFEDDADYQESKNFVLK